MTPSKKDSSAFIGAPIPVCHFAPTQLLARLFGFFKTESSHRNDLPSPEKKERDERQGRSKQKAGLEWGDYQVHRLSSSDYTITPVDEAKPEPATASMPRTGLPAR